MEIALPFLAVAAGLAALVWSADRFVAGAAAGARLLGVPPLVVGMIVVGFGTSAPELAVSAIGAARGNPEIALGNAYGSNICNVALILGISALLRPLVVTRTVSTRHLPALAGATLLSIFLVGAAGVSRLESFVFLALFAVALFFMARDTSAAPASGASAAEDSRPPRAARAAADTVVGLAVLVLSSRALVWGAVELAVAFGVSDLAIGLTVVAIGTSLPELASALAAVRRGEDDLAVGNVVGSNLFNTLAVVGLAGAIRPMPVVDPAVVRRDIPASLAVALALWILGRPRRPAPGAPRGPGRLGRPAGIAFLAFYAAYFALLAVSASSPR